MASKKNKPHDAAKEPESVETTVETAAEEAPESVTMTQEELNTVKAVDFADVAADEVRPGTTVVIRTAEGEERNYTVLGEWDNDLSRGIISNKTRLAQNLMGKKNGDEFELPDAEGNVSSATVVAVLPLSDDIRGWIQVPAGLEA